MHFDEESIIYIWSKFQLDTCMFDSNILLTKFGPGFWSRALVPGFIPSLFIKLIVVIYWWSLFCLCWGLTSQSTIFQSCRDGATASWVINQYFRGVKCLAQGHNTAAVGFEPRPLAPVRHSTTEPPRSPWWSLFMSILEPVRNWKNRK